MKVRPTVRMIVLVAIMVFLVFTFSLSGKKKSLCGQIEVTASAEQAAVLEKQVFEYTGDFQYFTVPAGVDRIKFKIWGAGGGKGVYLQNYAGGAGGYTSGDIEVNPGDQYVIVVGQGGIGQGIVRYGEGGDVTFGGGGYGTSGDAPGASGGGLSGIFSGSTPISFDASGQARAIAIAGGGGGSCAWFSGGGGGGGLEGLSTGGGNGGTQLAGGTGTYGADGSALKGGNGDARGNRTDLYYDGGGGGGGYYGGEGGFSDAKPGGGGSGFINPIVTNGQTIAGQSGPLQSAAMPPFISDIDYKQGIGIGGYHTDGANGGNGLVIIYCLQEKNPPFGYFETPIHGSTVSGSIPVTGWALDDSGIEGVKIYREQDNHLFYIGDAILVEGARPDVANAYPGYPNNTRAGWGYMLLTHFLPDKGNGTFVLHAIATDVVGKTTTLGSKTIYCDNANAVKPFGAIDTPGQGGSASGDRFVNWGWALTPQPNSIPTDGSTINVYVDGVNLGHPTYNKYRADIASFFPGYANSNGAAGFFYIDTTGYENGVHTIQWTATDSGGNTDGIGSRYFTIQNTSTSTSQTQNTRQNIGNANLSGLPVDYYESIHVNTGYNKFKQSQEIYPDDNGYLNIQVNELDRVEIHFAVPISNISTLPVGSALDAQKGIFYWGLGPGFLGEYKFMFVDARGFVRKVNITVAPK